MIRRALPGVNKDTINSVLARLQALGMITPHYLKDLEANDVANILLVGQVRSLLNVCKNG